MRTRLFSLGVMYRMGACCVFVVGAFVGCGGREASVDARGSAAGSSERTHLTTASGGVGNQSTSDRSDVAGDRTSNNAAGAGEMGSSVGLASGVGSSGGRPNTNTWGSASGGAAISGAGGNVVGSSSSVGVRNTSLGGASTSSAGGSSAGGKSSVIGGGGTFGGTSSSGGAGNSAGSTFGLTIRGDITKD